jgi:hypothetical protein
LQLVHSPMEASEQEQSVPTREPRWRPVCRFVLASLIGAGVAYLVWRRVPHTLSVTTDIVGYQTWVDFDYLRYLDAYYLIAIAFPLVSIAACFVLGRWGPLRRPRGDRPHLYQITTSLDEQSEGAAPVTVASPVDGRGQPRPVAPSTSNQAVPSAPAVIALFWTVARMAVPAVAVGIEVCLVRSPRQAFLARGGLAAGVGYLVVVGLSGVLLLRWQRAHPGERWLQATTTWRSAVALVNSLLSLSVLPLLFFVSEKTNVYVSSKNQVVYYHWLPLWLVIVVTIGCIALWIRGLRRMQRSTSTASALEATALTWLVGPIIFFLVLAVLPGALGYFYAFDDAQFLAAPQLIFHHGLFPWRDIFLLHGLLQDVFYGAVGLLVFGNTRWGGDAGAGLFMIPLFWLVVYAFTAYFCRKNRLVLVGLVVAVSTSLLQGNTFRFLVIFVFLILFDRVLRNPTWGWCSLFSGCLVVSCIIVPEALLFAVPLIVLVVIFDAVRYRRGASMSLTFRRSFRCISVGVLLLLAWAVYLAIVGALGDFVDYYAIAVTGHQLEGALPIQWNMVTTTMVTFEFIVPVVLWLMTVWRVVAKLRSRKSWTVADWVMVGAASFVVVYYPQVLERADTGHVLLVFSMTIPLLILWAIELLTLADGAISRFGVRFRQKQTTRSRSRLIGGATSEWPKRLVTAAVVAGIAVASIAMPISIPTLLRRIPANFHGAVPDSAPAASPMLGYTLPGTVDTAQINDLGKLLDRYAGRSAPVFDLVSEVGVTYYLLNRVPGTRSFIMAVAQTSLAQRQTISDLERSRPPVVIFYDTSFGLPVYDGILQSVRSPLVGQYVLDHYRPLVDVQGQLLMLRNDLVKSAPPLPPLPVGSQTSGLYFSIPACTLGDIPNFYQDPTGLDSAPGIRVHTVPIEDVGSTIGGWAVDPSTGGPAAEVLAVAGGKVVATAPTGIARPDVAAGLHDPSAETSGFSIDIPRSVHGPVTLYALSVNGSVTMLNHDSPAVPASAVGGTPQSSVSTSDGISHPAVDAGAAGWADSYQRVDQEILRLTFPRGTDLSSYRWLQLRSTSSLGNSSNFVTDDVSAGTTHQVSFNTLPRAGNHLSVQVGSCLQWHGYDSDAGLYLVRGGPGAERPVSVELRR